MFLLAIALKQITIDIKMDISHIQIILFFSYFLLISIQKKFTLHIGLEEIHPLSKIKMLIVGGILNYTTETPELYLSHIP